MTCKHFWTETIRVQEMGSREPLIQTRTRCRVSGRDPRDPGWQSRCRETAAEGPCWWWGEQHSDVADPHF